MSEKIIGITASTITGEKYFLSGLTNVHCRLIFTTERLVVQRTTSQMRENYPNLRIDPHQVRLVVEKGIEKILAESPQNLSIPYSDISRIDVGRRWLNPRMNVVTRNGTHRFTWFWPQIGVKSVESVVRSLFPPNILVERAKKV